MCGGNKAFDIDFWTRQQKRTKISEHQFSTLPINHISFPLVSKLSEPDNGGLSTMKKKKKSRLVLFPMACHSAYYASFSPSSSLKGFGLKKRKLSPFQLQVSSIGNTARAPYNTLVSEAVRLLGPPASFEASKLKVVFMGEGLKYCSAIIPRTYILSHCDFTANLTLTISNVINLDQLKGWYNNDDVVAEWKKVKETMFLNVHCYVSGPNLLLELAAEFRYHIFSKELPLVLKAVLNGDSVLFAEHPELMDALVCVYFHSSLPKYNRMECWGSLKDAAEGKLGDQVQGLLTADKESNSPPAKLGRNPKSIFQALFTFLL